MAKLKANLNIIASALLLITLITVPAIVGYVHDFLSSLTHQKIIRYVEDEHIVSIDLGWYNSTASRWQWENQAFVYDDANHTIILPSIEQTAPSAREIRMNISLNASYYLGKWLWDAKVEHMIVAISTSTNITLEKVSLFAYDDAGNVKQKDFHINKNGTDITADIKLTYAMRAWFSQYTGTCGGGGDTGLAIGLRITNPSTLDGEYMELRIYFTRTERSWVAGISDAVLAGIGVLMIVAAALATPYVSLKDLARPFRRGGQEEVRA